MEGTVKRLESVVTILSSEGPRANCDAQGLGGPSVARSYEVLERKPAVQAWQCLVWQTMTGCSGYRAHAPAQEVCRGRKPSTGVGLNSHVKLSSRKEPASE